MPMRRERRNQIDWLIQVGYTAWRLFVKNELHNHAAATAFYFLLSAAPLILLVSYAVQALAVWAETSNLATVLLAALYDQFQLDELMRVGFIPSRGALAVGGASLVTLVLSSRGLLNAIQSAFRVIFPHEHKRRLLVSWTLPLLLIPTLLGLAILAVLARIALDTLVSAGFLGAADAESLRLINTALALASFWLLIFALYWRLPLPHPNMRLALLFATFTAFSLGLLGLLFGKFFSVEKYHAVYGALGGVVFILIGAYLAGMIFYFWAQCLYAVGKVDVAALEKLFLAADTPAENRLEAWVFDRADRLLDSYGRVFPAGETLISEGDQSDWACFLYSGRVSLYKATGGVRKKLGTLEAGQLFGEMAYLLHEPRTATAIAETEVTALVLPPALLEELMRYSAPLSRHVIGALCQRLERMNKQL